jgi:DivIVA domain-containing protein
MSSKTFEPTSEAIGPTEIKNKEFKRTVWGYAPQEVVDFLDVTAKAWERVQRHEKEMLDEIRSLRMEIDRWKAREAEVNEINRQAQLDAEELLQETKKEADLLFAQARNKAEEVRQQTEAWLAKVISEVEDMERKREHFVAAFRTALDQHYHLLEEDGGPLKKPFETRLDRFISKEERPLPS